MYIVMRYPLDKGREMSEEYDTFDCTKAQVEEVVKALRGLEDGHWYWALPSIANLLPATPTNPHELREQEIRSSVTALLAS